MAKRKSDGAVLTGKLTKHGETYVCVSNLALFRNAIGAAEGDTILSTLAKLSKNDQPDLLALSSIALEVMPPLSKQGLEHAKLYLAAQAKDATKKKLDRDVCENFVFKRESKLKHVSADLRTPGVCNKGLCRFCDSMRYHCEKSASHLTLATVARALTSNHVHNILTGDKIPVIKPVKTRPVPDFLVDTTPEESEHEIDLPYVVKAVPDMPDVSGGFVTPARKRKSSPHYDAVSPVHSSFDIVDTPGPSNDGSYEPQAKDDSAASYLDLLTPKYVDLDFDAL